MRSKPNSMVFKTLGSSLEHSISIKFDYEIAKQFLQYYKHQDVEKINIPSCVSQVSYVSDLSKINPASINNLKSKKYIFNLL